MPPMKIPRDPQKYYDRIRPRPHKVRGLKRPPRKPKLPKPPELTDAQLIANGAYAALRARRERRRRMRLQRIMNQRAYARRLMRKQAPPGASEILKRIVRWEESS